MEALQCIEGRPGVVTLSGALAGSELADARDALLDSLANSASLELDLSGVTTIDERGAELLLRMHHEALTTHKPLTLVGMRSAVGEALDGMQLGRVLAVSVRSSWSA